MTSPEGIAYVMVLIFGAIANHRGAQLGLQEEDGSPKAAWWWAKSYDECLPVAKPISAWIGTLKAETQKRVEGAIAPLMFMISIMSLVGPTLRVEREVRNELKRLKANGGRDGGGQQSQEGFTPQQVFGPEFAGAEDGETAKNRPGAIDDFSGKGGPGLPDPWHGDTGLDSSAA